MMGLLGLVSLLAHIYNLNNIKAKTVGDGQHGTARWATKAEIRKTYRHVPFTPEKWRKQAAKGQTPTAAGVLKKGKIGKTDRAAGRSAAPGHCGGLHRRQAWNHRHGGHWGCPCADDWCGRRWQNRLLAVSLHRVRLRQRHEFSLHRYQRRCHAKLWEHRQGLWVQRFGNRPEKPDPFQWK